MEGENEQHMTYEYSGLCCYSDMSHILHRVNVNNLSFFEKHRKQYSNKVLYVHTYGYIYITNMYVYDIFYGRRPDWQQFEYRKIWRKSDICTACSDLDVKPSVKSTSRHIYK
jgi:hypothetical protein